MNKKLLLTLALSLFSLLSACASAPKAESPAETAEIATIALNSSLDLSQEGRQPILPQEYDKTFVAEILEKDSPVAGMLEEDRPPFFYYTGDGSMDGLDVEISLGIANTFGVELEPDRTARSNQEIYENLAQGRYDRVASKFSMTPEQAMGGRFRLRM